MAKQSGLAWTTLDIDDAGSTAQDLREDVNSFSFSTPINVAEVTGIDKSAVERILLLRDFSINLQGTFDDDTSYSVHDVFADIMAAAATSRTTGINVSGQALVGIEVLYTDYALNRAADGQLTFTVPGVLADGTIPAWTTP
jgi:hypothetical protein